MGPKPFTPPKFNESESFDKVFSVPVAPGVTTSTSNGLADAKLATPVVVVAEKPATPPEEGDEEEAEKAPELPVADGDQNGKTAEETEYIPKTPSTAERRKLFENRTNSKETEQEDNFEATDGGFERSSMQRSSIAERRKMYERSQSVQDTPAVVSEKPEGSPILLRRKDSLKNRKNEEENKAEVNRKSVPFAKQQSLDPQAHRKSELVTPTPKRTSTVFGKCENFTTACFVITN